MDLSSPVDLHIHSTYSDGLLSPVELVDLSCSHGLAAIAITDHDTAAGTPEAMARGVKKGIEVISGIEISSWHNETSMHILGYNFISNDAQFNSRLQLLQNGRETRNVRIFENFKKLGIRLDIAELLRYSEYGQTGRPHIARLLVDKGISKTVDQAFKEYLGRGAAAYAERFRFSAKDAIGMIRDAGGIAVLAHPANLDPTLRTIPPLLRALSKVGLGGVEVYYPSHSPNTVKALLKMARELDLLITGGSDFHDMQRPGMRAADWFHRNHIPIDIVTSLKKWRQNKS